MRTLIALLIVALLGFYVAWPAYTRYRIKAALESGNADLLAAKIDFDSVRETLRPAVTAEVEKAATKGIEANGGNNAALLQQLKTQMMPQLVEAAMASVVTPETVLRVYSEGGNVRATLAKIIAEKTGGGLMGGAAGAPGGKGGIGDLVGVAGKALGLDIGKALGSVLGGSKPAADVPAPDTAASPAPAAAPAYGLGNIKSFAFKGPLGYSVGLAKDKSAADPDVTVDLAFRGGDWKIVGLTPRS